MTPIVPGRRVSMQGVELTCFAAHAARLGRRLIPAERRSVDGVDQGGKTLFACIWLALARRAKSGKDVPR